MRHQIATLSLALALALSATAVATAAERVDDRVEGRDGGSSVQLGPRPFFLVNEMEDGRLKRQLQRCTAGPFKKSDFSIGHRGAALQFPEHTRDAKEAGLDIITWTLERSGLLADRNNGFYYQTIDQAIAREGDLYKVIDALARDVGVLGVFSDWAAPVTYYANCMGLK